MRKSEGSYEDFDTTYCSKYKVAMLFQYAQDAGGVSGKYYSMSSMALPESQLKHYEKEPKTGELRYVWYK
ncbi:MAG: hypothetical protein K6G26_03150 [Lachnospiraceae bacterium]|nr:hypothetical protein [Lachnospiraceae bacterium]